VFEFRENLTFDNVLNIVRLVANGSEEQPVVVMWEVFLNFSRISKMIYILHGRNNYNPEPRVFALLSKTEQEANVNPVRPPELQCAGYSNSHVT